MCVQGVCVCVEGVFQSTTISAAAVCIDISVCVSTCLTLKKTPLVYLKPLCTFLFLAISGVASVAPCVAMVKQ